MDNKISSRKFFQDPVHGTIVLEPDIRDQILNVIDTPEVQRLRRISHLGASLYTFHGAEHSRFGHAMGTMSIMNRVTLQFQQQGIIDDDSLRLKAVLAALLHDVGHGPFSHLFEEVTEDYDHEAVGRKIILESPLSKKVPDSEGVVNLLRGIAEPENRWITELLSGPLDVDKMDYLLRDSHYTGVAHGKYDFDRLLFNLGIYEDKGRQRLGVWNKGRGVLESFILARDQMFWSVYYHKTTRGVEQLIHAIFSRVVDLLEKGEEVGLSPPLEPVLRGKELETAEIEELDDSTVLEHLKLWRRSKDAILSDLANRLFKRDLFKMLDITQLDDGLYENRQKIEEEFAKLGLDLDYYLRKDTPENSPYTLPYFDDKAKPAVVLSRDGNGTVIPQEISEVSDLVDAVKNIERKKTRIYSTREGTAKLRDVLGL